MQYFTHLTLLVSIMMLLHPLVHEEQLHELKILHLIIIYTGSFPSLGCQNNHLSQNNVLNY